ncbi:MAG: ABC transporter ATP-binding protein [Deltaproteobacteria bacterium]|nr:ABC transporter ATP-binding protein [Deltaproteobacteria bacterium]
MKQSLQRALTMAKTQLPYLSKTFGLVYRAAGFLTAAGFVLLLIQGLLPVASVYLTKIIVDGVADLIRTGGGIPALLRLLPAVAAMASVLIGMEVFQSISRWLRTAQSEQVQDYIHTRIHEQAMRLDLSFYDSPDYYDQLHRARIDALNRPAALIENTGALLQSLVTLLAMAGVLLTFGVWIPILLAASTLPALAVVMRHSLRFHDWRLRNTMAIRQTNYYDMMLTSREGAAEMRLFQLGPHFRRLFSDLRARLRREKINLARDEAVATAWAALLGLAGMAGVLAWMGLQAARGLLTLGDLALLLQAFFQGQRMMRSLLGSAGEIYRNITFLENLFEFLALTPNIREPHQQLPHPGLKDGIKMENIIFRYPGSSRPALDHFHLSLPAGSITAVVGENGAGKSTLIKLLSRFYDPTDGRILLDDIDIRTLSQEDLRRHITVLFQEPVRFHDTVFNNIAFGDLEHKPDLLEIEEAAKAAGADAPISRLPETYAAVLGKWFGGAELSGGEWQRLALARAFLRKAQLVILDEPTSSMDSWAEVDWLMRFRQLVTGRTALIITHRFTTAMQADVIHVMDQGRIIESGSHKDLLSAGGRYAASWTRQMQGGQIADD